MLKYLSNDEPRHPRRSLRPGLLFGRLLGHHRLQARPDQRGQEEHAGPFSTSSGRPRSSPLINARDRPLRGLPPRARCSRKAIARPSTSSPPAERRRGANRSRLSADSSAIENITPQPAQDLDPGDRQARAQHRLPRDDGLHDALHRPLRHGLGHHDRLPQHRASRARPRWTSWPPASPRPSSRRPSGSRSPSRQSSATTTSRARSAPRSARSTTSPTISSTSCRGSSTRRSGEAPWTQASRRGDRSPISQINVTPLVDVMLVLLIIFMVTATVGQQGVTVSLPRAYVQGPRRLRGDRHRHHRQVPPGLRQLEARGPRPAQATRSSRSTPIGRTSPSSSRPTRAWPTATS